MIQWGGFGFKWPLSEVQLTNLIESAEAPESGIKLLKLVEKPANRTAGHIEILRIDYTSKTAWLGRVLIYKELRNKGLGDILLNLTLDLLFLEMEFKEVKLNVFDFNGSAFRCYQRAGFAAGELQKNSRKQGDRLYSHYCMSITRKEFLQKRNSSQ